ncbi:MAG: hypothetical protein D3904_12280, partial [Candidatus Electrothrix sp. EH2]|nr:hypothetical protein [Candidatus Electrothrix sp. EH2]
TPVRITFAETAETAIESAVAASTPAPINDDQWIITLQTDTLLGSPEKLNERSGSEDLRVMYEQAWAELSKEGEDTTLILERYFARQKLFGGRYRHEMAKRQRTDAEYRPWLLTEAGTCFVLRAVQGKEATAQEKITDWLAHGLPLSSSVCRYYGIEEDEEQQWRQTPFLPRNGYGEIAVNMHGMPSVIALTNNSPEVDCIRQPSEKIPENKEAGHEN